MREEELVRAEDRLRAEFNRWAEAGRGEEMQEEHAALAAGMLSEMAFSPNDKILDVGCGAGWLSAILADKVPQGQVVGLDVADEMVRRARKRYAGKLNLMFVIASAEDIPWDEEFFNHAVSIEAAYYWADPVQAFREIHRVLQPGGTLRILINLFKENVHSHGWQGKLAVPTQLLSGAEWRGLVEQAGFRDTWESRVVDPRPVPEDYRSEWFQSPQQLREFRREGALLVFGQKPDRS